MSIRHIIAAYKRMMLCEKVIKAIEIAEKAKVMHLYLKDFTKETTTFAVPSINTQFRVLNR